MNDARACAYMSDSLLFDGFLSAWSPLLAMQRVVLESGVACKGEGGGVRVRRLPCLVVVFGGLGGMGGYEKITKDYEKITKR